MNIYEVKSSKGPGFHDEKHIVVAHSAEEALCAFNTEHARQGLYPEVIGIARLHENVIMERSA